MADAVAQIQDPNEILNKLSGSISSYQAPANWAYDPQYEAATNAINTNIARLKSNNQLAQQRIGEDFTTNVGKAAQINDANLKGLATKLGSQGTSYSSVNVGEQGRLGEAYQESLTGINRNKTRSEENLAFDTANQAAQWQNQLSAVQADRAGRQAAREQEQAAIEAQAKAANDSANAQRQWMEQLTSKLTALAQPQAQPTGKVNAPPPANAIVQQAIRAIPPPAVKSPQQQLSEIGVPGRDLQKMLQIRGFDPGPIDGVMGKKTQTALARWKQSVGLPATGDINPEIWKRLVSSGTGNISAGSIAPTGNKFPSTGPARAVMM